MGNDKDQSKSYRKAFWIAVIMTIGAWLLPFGELAIYPFSLFATWAHEMGHGLTALLVGGSFDKLEVFGNLSGLAHTASPGPLSQGLVAAGGLIGPPILGALVVAVGPRIRFARAILYALGGVLLLSVMLWVRNPFGVIALSLLAIGAGAVAWRFGAWRCFVAVQLVGIQLSLSALRNWRYLFTDHATIDGTQLPSDVGLISKAIGAPYWLWGALILAFNLAILYGAYRLVLRRLRRATGKL